MYEPITLKDLKKQLRLSEDYKVDACIVYGSFSEKKSKKKFYFF